MGVVCACADSQKDFTGRTTRNPLACPLLRLAVCTTSWPSSDGGVGFFFFHMNLREVKHWENRPKGVSWEQKQRLKEWTNKIGGKNLDWSYWNDVANGKVSRHKLKKLRK